MPHVPHRCAHVLGHGDAVAGVAGEERVHRHGLEIVALHFLVVLEPAAGEDHPFSRSDGDLLALVLRQQSDDAVFRIPDEPLGRRGQTHRDVAPHVDVVQQDLEKARAAAQALGPREALVAFHGRDLEAVETVAAREGVGAAVPLLFQFEGRFLDEILHEVLHLRHALGQGSQHIVRGPPRVGVLQILERLFLVHGGSDAAAGKDRDAAGVGHLFHDGDLGAGVRRLYRGHASGEAETHHQHVCLNVPAGREPVIIVVQGCSPFVQRAPVSRSLCRAAAPCGRGRV